ncbi:MAG: hypothetical protein Q9185_005812 [Variospora sp. 1 TL-2023]
MICCKPMMVSRIGLTRLYPIDDEDFLTAHTVDIVFVHGLFGHPEKTWSFKKDEGSLFWPQTLLPKVIPEAHIFSWGYDADVGGIFSSAGQSTIHEHAGSLLSDLADLRYTPDRRYIPLIFVVHSLGGIVVKDALNQSSSTEGTRLKDIAPATHGVVFLGTPHRGSTSASMGKMAFHITEVFTQRPNLKLLRGLEKHSDILDRVGDSFYQTIMKHNLSVYSFREARETRRYKVFSIMVVESDSAKIGYAKEECGIIPSDHRNMTKYSGPEDIGFKRVSAQLRRWNEDIKAVFADCLESLNSVEARSRLEEVDRAHPATFGWLFDAQQVPFLEWLQASDGLGRRPFWIQGKPGSGKSTLMKFAIRNPRTLKALAGPRAEKWTFSGYFFHDRGSQAQKTILGMLQELLHSILRQNISLVPFVIPFYYLLRDEQRTRRPRWHSAILGDAIGAVLRKLPARRNLCLFLDALDEHAGGNEELVSLIWNWIAAANDNSTTVHIKICLASRPWDIFKKTFGQCPQFAIHEHTRGDIEMYTTQRIRKAMYTSEPSPAEAELIKQVVRDASGVFIWVRLVLDRIVQEIIDGTPFPTLQHLVSQLPSELGELYRWTVQRIRSGYHAETWIMFQTILCALRPLLLEDLIMIVELNFEPTQKDPLYVFGDRSSKENQLRRLNSRSGGLLEALPRSGHVQFIHQTVKDTITQSGVDLGFALNLGFTHDTSMLFTRIYARNGYEFILRAVKDVPRVRSDALIYAKLADQSAANDPDCIGTWNLLKDEFTFSDSSGWDQLYRWVQGAPVSDVAISRAAIIAYVIATGANLTRFTEDSQTLSHHEEITLEFGSYLMALAAIGPEVVAHPLCDNQRSKVIEALRGLGCHGGFEIKMPYEQSEFDAFSLDCPAHPANKRWNPLTGLILKHLFRPSKDHLNIAKALVRNGAEFEVSLLIKDKDNPTVVPVSLCGYCVRYGNVDWVHFLLAHGATQTSTRDCGSESGYSLADCASLRRDCGIIQVLKDYGLGESEPDGILDLSPVKTGILTVSEALLSTSGCYPVRRFPPAEVPW